MQFRGLLLAAAALAVLGGLYLWSERAKKAEQNKPAAETPPKLITAQDDKIQSVEIRKKGSPPVLIEKTGAGWKITQPEPLAADQDAVSSVISTLNGLTWDRLVEEKSADLGPFGLNDPQIEVTLKTKDGKQYKLLIGDDTPTGNGAFARLDGDSSVFTIASYTKSSLDKTAQDLRDKRLLTFNSEKLTRVELTAKGQTMEFGKNAQNEWQIVKPKPLRADNFQIEEIVRKLRDARMDTSISQDQAKKAAQTFAAAQRIAVAKVTDASGSQELEVRKAKDGSYWARSSVVPGVYKVSSELGEGLDKKLEDLRNKKLFDFGFSDPSKITIRDGDVTYSFEKSGDKWKSGGREMDSTGVQSLIDKLRDLAATRFLDKAAPNPILEITVVSNDGKRTEKVLVSKSGSSFTAVRENESSAYELEAKAVEDIQRAARDVKPAPPPAQPKK